jgi:hypothetical protein
MADLDSSKQSTGTRESTTTTTRTGPQTYGGGAFNANQLVSQLISGFTQAQGQLKQAGTDLTGADARRQEAQANQVADLSQEITERGKVAEEKATIDYLGNSLKESFQTQYGMNPNDKDNLIAQNVAKVNTLRPQIEDTEQQRLQAKSAYDAAASVDMLHNPLGYIMAQLKLPQLAAQHNALASQKDALVSEMDRINNDTQTQLGLTDSTKKVISANTADLARSYELRQAKADSLIAQAKLEQAKAQNASLDASSIMQRAQLVNLQNNEQRQTTDTIIRVKDYNEMQVLRRAQLAQTQESTRQMMDARKLKADQEAAINARFKVISAGLGMQFPMTIENLKKLGRPDLEESWLNAAGTLSFGNDLDKSLRFFDQANRQVLLRSNSSLVVTGDQLGKAVESQLAPVIASYRQQNLGKDMPMKEQKPAAAALYLNLAQSSAMDRTSKTDLADPYWDKNFSPYKLPIEQFNKVVQSDASLAPLRDNVMTKALATLAPTTPGQHLGPEHERLALESVASLVKAGTLDPIVAGQQVADYYRTGTKWNADMNQAHMFGFLPQTGYQYSVPSGQLFGGRIKADLMDPAQVTNMLVRKTLQVGGMNYSGATPEELQATLYPADLPARTPSVKRQPFRTASDID